jgi:hypothetical protein
MRCHDADLTSFVAPAVKLHSNAGKCALGSKTALNSGNLPSCFVLKSRTETNASFGFGIKGSALLADIDRLVTAQL